MKKISNLCYLNIIFVNFLTPAVFAQSGEELAKEIANPLTSMTLVPFQLSLDSNIGSNDDGDRQTLNIQPLTSFSINDDWNIISRTIVPLIHQDDIFPGAGEQSGLGDVLQSFFISPEQLTESGWTWGVGPALLLPTATDDLLGTDKWGLGPTAVAAKVDGPWTTGVLVNHIESFAGTDSKPDVSATFIQPFFDYTTKNAVTYELTAESTYNWKSKDWSIPVMLTANKFVQVGNQPILIGGGLRYWAASADSDPEGWALNISLYLLFPN